MRTEKQIKSSRRNFMIMYLTGVLATLNLFKNVYVLNPFWKEHLTEIIHLIETLITRIKTKDFHVNMRGKTTLINNFLTDGTKKND